MPDTARPYLIEASWEVCNKVGGIHTVITSKLRHTGGQFGDRYLAVGPWLGEAQRTVFSEEPAPEHIRAVMAALSGEGIIARYGHWLVDERPSTLLLEWSGLVSRSGSIKASLWERFKLDTLGTDFYDFDQPLLWSVAVGMLADALAAEADAPVILHAHEWLAGGAVLTAHHPAVHSVFTTHATVLGRALSSRDVFIYDKLKSFDPEAEARSLNVVAKHGIEALAARTAAVFTTVSGITADEAEAFLGRRAEITENGIDLTQLPEYDRVAALRLEMRGRLDQFVSAYFFPHYRFDLSKTTYQYTMGRYEIRNKGYDLHIEALGELNRSMRERGDERTVVAFILVPGDMLRLNPETDRQLKTWNRMEAIAKRASLSMAPALVTGDTPVPDPAAAELLDQLRSTLPRGGSPSVSPFDMRSENDAVFRLAYENGLTNSADDRVKIVFFPVYLDGFDGVLNRAIYDVAAGCDLGIFPSLYEPWGYTPLESVALGVPAITSTLAGFGSALGHFDDLSGVTVLNRSGNDRDAERAALLAGMERSLGQSAHQRSVDRLGAHALAHRFDWQRLYGKYVEAYEHALAS